MSCWRPPSTDPLGLLDSQERIGDKKDGFEDEPPDDFDQEPTCSKRILTERTAILESKKVSKNGEIQKERISKMDQKVYKKSKKLKKSRP